MTDVLGLDVSDRVATVTLDRPKARNALNRDLRRALHRTMQQVADDDGVDVVILTGSDPAFCAGLDLKELGASADASVDALASDDEKAPPQDRGPFPRIAKPVIGAINGVAITGGFELALRCDLLIASERAAFADTHARVGIMPDWGLTVLLPQAVGVRRARELSTTGNFLDARTALSWGLVNHVVPHAELLPFCRSLAADIVSNDQRGVRRILQTYEEGALLTAGDAWQLETTVAKTWQGEGLDPAAIEARRAAVTERGRTQV
ncbi:MAG TPA: enoyl-CoA hydratase [Acidimicrobiales bacterium]|nr:enoyl-CoA hydratase [Acidimicrobiales bacterium]